ncbi:heavy metal translocating P-type ATPase [Proteinivorax hydrogeniformans]|uniref:Cd(2+)-exporting ATPase n=1 Tax=Proteinivorax hydrogeniformans TaxID=1826727 RepID=A0AAU8HVU5_9FIRM
MKVTYHLNGLDCANCANKIEKRVKTLSYVEKANLNFVSKKLMVEVNEGKDPFEDIKNIVKDLEPHVEITRKENTNNNLRGIFGGIEKQKLFELLIAIFLFGTAVFMSDGTIRIGLFLASYAVIGYDVLFKAVNNILKGRIFDENFLMTIATIGALIIAEYPEAVAVMLFYKIGIFVQNLAVNHSKRSISELMDIKSDYAHLKLNGKTKKVNPEDVNIGDIILVKPGEKVPLDGVVISGNSLIDSSALTGESVPIAIKKGSQVLSGSINQKGLLEIKVQKEFSQSTVKKILELVENASSKKSNTENFITKFAKYYTPAVVGIATLLTLIPVLFFSGEFTTWVYRSLVFLVISCPCALVVSIPLGFFGGIGASSKKGVLVKGSNFLEGLNNINTVVFDKTGTITEGIFKVNKVISKNKCEDEVLYYAAHVEFYSNHPIAQSVVKAYNKEIDEELVAEFSEISGKGVKAKVNNRPVIVGNRNFLLQEGIEAYCYQSEEDEGSALYVAVDKELLGIILIGDKIKKESYSAIKGLNSRNINTVMLTGDSNKVAKQVSEKLQIGSVYSELLPHQKVEKFEQISNQSTGNTAFIGDGINDAPVIARSDIGIAMGGLGSDAAIEAADIVVMQDNPYKIIEALEVAKRTRSIVWQNIVLALGVKGIVLVLGAFGLASMWEAVFADVGVSLIAVLNSVRILRA